MCTRFFKNCPLFDCCTTNTQ